jgi:hypothetical protein
MITQASELQLDEQNLSQRDHVTVGQSHESFQKEAGSMNDYVWLSMAMVDTARLRPFTHDLTDPVSGRANSESLKSIESNIAGEPLGRDAFPAKIWGRKKDFAKLPDIFFGYGYHVVSERCADVLRHFDLGGGRTLSRRRFSERSGYTDQ